MKFNRCDVSEFGKRLRALRLERGYSMDTFCEKYNEKTGQRLSKSTVSRWENNLQEPLVSTVAAIAVFFGVSPLWLLGESEERKIVTHPPWKGDSLQEDYELEETPPDEEVSLATLSEEAMELLEIFNVLNVKNRTKLLMYAYELESGKEG